MPDLQRDVAIDQTVAELIRRSAEANEALMRGDVGRYRPDQACGRLHADVALRRDAHARFGHDQ